MPHDAALFDHYYPVALQVIGNLPSSGQAQPEHLAMQAGQLALAALTVRDQLLAGGSIKFADAPPSQSYPRGAPPMGSGISVSVQGPGGPLPSGPPAPAPQAAPQYVAPPQAYAPPAGPPQTGMPYQQAPLGGGAMPPGVGVTIRDPNGQQIG